MDMSLLCCALLSPRYVCRHYYSKQYVDHVNRSKISLSSFQQYWYVVGILKISKRAT